MALALPNSDWECGFVAALTDRRGAARQSGWEIEVRRCLGIEELLGDAIRAPVAAVIVDANFPQLTAAAVAHLQAQPPGVLALCVDESAEKHARQLGFDHVLAMQVGDPDRTAVAVLATVLSLSVAARPSERPRPGSNGQPQGPSGSDAVAEGADANLAISGWGADRTDSPGGLGAPPAGSTEESGRVITFWGPAGAPGRTSLALAVAHTLARRSIETMVIDADTRAPGVAAALGVLDVDSGLASAANLANRGALDAHSLARQARQLEATWRVLTGVRSPHDWRQIPAVGAQHVIRCAVALCQLVVVDVGSELECDDELLHDQLVPRRDAAAIAACAAADAVVAVCGPEPTSLARLCSQLPRVTATAPAAEIVIVVNRARAGLGPVASEAEIRRILGDAIDAHVEFVPNDQRTFDAATCRAVLPTEYAPRSPFATAVERLTDYLSARHRNRVAVS